MHENIIYMHVFIFHISVYTRDSCVDIAHNDVIEWKHDDSIDIDDQCSHNDDVLWDFDHVFQI